MLRLITQTFPEQPQLAARVFRGESGLRQWYDNGKVVTSHTNDYGLCQINAPTWDATAKELGLDYLNNIKEHIQLCRHIYEQAGNSFTPWVYYNVHIAMR